MKYDPKKCKSNWVKGYSGCGCEYCQWFRKQPSKWKAGLHGNHKDYEIFIARENNRHAFESWGWDGKDKVIVGKGTVPKDIFELLKKKAAELARELNEKESLT